MHFKETVSILSLKCKLNQIKKWENVKILLTYPLDPLTYPLGDPPLKNLIYPLLTPEPLLYPLKKNFNILGGQV